MKSFLKWSFMAVMSVAALMPAIVFAEFPEKPITYTIPFNPGGESDITARLQEPEPVSYTHLTLPTTLCMCRSRWSPSH